MIQLPKVGETLTSCSIFPWIINIHEVAKKTLRNSQYTTRSRKQINTWNKIKIVIAHKHYSGQNFFWVLTSSKLERCSEMHFKMDLNEHFSANFFFKLSGDFNFRGPFSPGFFRAWRRSGTKTSRRFYSFLKQLSPSKRQL